MRQHSAIVTITGRVYVPSEDVEAAFEAGELDGVEVVSREDAFEGLAHKRILEELFSYRDDPVEHYETKVDLSSLQTS